MSESRPGLYVYRPVLNLDRPTLNAAFTAASLHDIPVPDTVSPRLQANIMGPGEFSGAYDQLDAPFDNEEADQLGNFLYSYMPPSSDERLTVPTLPSKLQRDKGRQNLRIGGNNSTVNTERIVVQALVKCFNAAPGLRLEWPENDLPSWVLVGKFNDDREGHKARLFQGFLHQHPDLLPAELVYGPISIDNV